MPKFAANLSMLFNEVPFLDRFEAAATAGFRGVEYVGPYDYPAEQIAELLHRHDLKQVLFNLPAGNWAAGERGIGCHPDRIAEFEVSVETAIHYAKVLGCGQVNCLAGLRPAGTTPEAAEATFIRNLRHAAEEFEKAGILLIAEPINFYDMPGFFLNRSAQAIAIFDQVGSDNLKLQYDIYHMQRMEGELARTIERLMPRIAHFQIAGNPNRTEPDRGEINYPFLYDFIDGLGYTGWIGAEYRPVRTTVEGLGWLRAVQHG
ncbi:MAG: hydroxypyruvate isomerase [Alphaproteobacteria bacterium]|nr:hydroxypyruvate isomerase [Alphaproteobacteria bacterium]